MFDIISVFAGGLVGSIIVTALIAAAGIDPLAPLPFAVIFGGQSAASFLIMWLLSMTRGSGSLAADFGLIVRGSDWWGVPAGMALQIAIAVITAPLIIWLFPEGAPEQGIAEIAGESQSVIDQLAVFLSVAVAAPLIEEMLFRGMLLSWLVRRMRSWLAIGVSAGAFAGIHLLDPNAIAVIPGLFLLGLVLAWVAIKRGDLSLAIPIHSGINLLAAISILYGPQLLEWSDQQIEQLEGILHFFPF
jgi:membrane protease YdiL (CAAX protease family)